MPTSYSTPSTAVFLNTHHLCQSKAFILLTVVHLGMMKFDNFCPLYLIFLIWGTFSHVLIYTHLKCEKRCAFLSAETEPPVPLKGLQLQMLQFHQVCQQQPTCDVMPWSSGRANLPETNFAFIADKHLLLSMLHWLTCMCHSFILLFMVHFY